MVSVFVVLFVSGTCCVVRHQTHQLSSQADELESCNHRINDLEQEVVTARQEAESFRTSNGDLRRQVGRLSSDLRDAEDRVDQFQDECPFCPDNVVLLSDADKCITRHQATIRQHALSIKMFERLGREADRHNGFTNSEDDAPNNDDGPTATEQLQAQHILEQNGRLSSLRVSSSQWSSSITSWSLRIIKSRLTT